MSVRDQIGKVHLLEVAPGMSPQAVRKLARRCAMTGGVEFGLAEGLSNEDLELIAQVFEPELQKHTPGSAHWRSNNSYRILSLIVEHPKVVEATKTRIKALLEGS